MKTTTGTSLAILLSSLLTWTAQAQPAAQHPSRALAGTAAGSGVLLDPQNAQAAFAPTHAAVFQETTKFGTYTWLVLSTAQPMLSAQATNVSAALGEWCTATQSPYFAVKLEDDFEIHTWFSCTAEGGKRSGMVSSANGLDSVALTLDTAMPTHWQGTLRTGTGNCGDRYCEHASDYTFVAR